MAKNAPYEDGHRQGAVRNRHRFTILRITAGQNGTLTQAALSIRRRIRGE